MLVNVYVFEYVIVRAAFMRMYGKYLIQEQK